MRIERFRRACVAVVSLSLVSLGMQAPAFAAVVGTAEAIAAGQKQDSLETVHAALARDEVRSELTALGVDAAEIEGRLAALSDAELTSLAQHIAAAPAGGDALAVIGAVFLVLLILEITGVIDIFKKT
ncbi:MAG: PA2779 family protein [Steroidobacteraceae bacterium]